MALPAMDSKGSELKSIDDDWAEAANPGPSDVSASITKTATESEAPASMPSDLLSSVPPSAPPPSQCEPPRPETDTARRRIPARSVEVRDDASPSLDRPGSAVGATRDDAVASAKPSSAVPASEPASVQAPPTVPPPPDYAIIRQTSRRNVYTPTPSTLRAPTPSGPSILVESSSSPIYAQSGALRLPVDPSISDYHAKLRGDSPLRGRPGALALIVTLVTIGVSCIIAAAILVMKTEESSAAHAPPPVVMAPAAPKAAAPADPDSDPAAAEPTTPVLDLANAAPTAPAPTTTATPTGVAPPTARRSDPRAAPPAASAHPAPHPTTSGSAPPGLQFLKRNL